MTLLQFESMHATLNPSLVLEHSFHQIGRVLVVRSILLGLQFAAHQDPKALL
jgi:hypothetical protein